MIKNSENQKAYFVGGGIASLAGAAYLIRDANFLGKNIYIFESSQKLGGSLDAQNRPASEGYVMRGVRMFEEKAFSSTFDLMSFIPSLENPEKTIREIFVDFNTKNKTYSKSRLVVKGQSVDSGPLGLCLRDRLSLIKLIITKESSLGIESLEDYFTPSFFKSNFWFEFCTAFAFLPWHS
ncbi:MAG: oleate hydratase, partial [Candidatus Magasanikbacteria bacterium]|nr:oleate hydratase [Candidatus Magasanikbacteria bacterium]